METRNHLDDALTPSLVAFAREVLTTPTAELVSIAAQLSTPPALQTYVAQWDEWETRAAATSWRRREAWDPTQGQSVPGAIAPRTLVEAEHLNRLYRMIDFNTNPRREVPAEALATDRVDTFVWAPADSALAPEGLWAVGRYVMLPVGTWGRPFSEALVTTVLVLMVLVDRLYGDASRELGAQHRDLLINHTARGDEAAWRSVHTERMVPQIGTAQLYEACLTVAQTIWFVAQSLPPDATWDVVKAVITGRSPSTLAATIPVGLIGHMAFKGRYIPGLAETSPSGLPTIERSMLRRLAAFRDAQWQPTPHRTYRQLVEFNRMTGFGCPVAGTGLLAFADAFRRVYSAIQAP